MEARIAPRQEPRFFWKLFTSTFLISACTVGGGYVIIPIMKAKFVDQYGWLDDTEALNLVAIAQASPGVVAINMAVVMGYRLAGWRGLATTLLATVLPPLGMLTVIAYCYHAFMENIYVAWALKGMQIAATALIVKVALDLLSGMWQKRQWVSIAIATCSFVAAYVFHVNIMFIVLVCAFLGLLCMRRGSL